MSSFIIEKREYVKCAGLLFGYEEAKRDNHRWYLDHLYDWFVRCYELNVASVNEQYGDNAELDVSLEKNLASIVALAIIGTCLRADQTFCKV